MPLLSRMHLVRHLNRFRTVRILSIIFIVLLTNLSEVLAEADATSTKTSTEQQSASLSLHRHGGDREDNANHHTSFFGSDHRVVRRQAGTPVPTNIGNNQPLNYQLPPGSTLLYSFQALPTTQPQARKDNEDIYGHDSLKRRNDDDANLEKPEHTYDDEVGPYGDLIERQTAAAKMVWISINTCLLPEFQSPQDQVVPPQLSIAWHTDRGPDSGFWHSMELIQGYQMFNVTTDNSVIVQITSPQVGVVGQGAWNYDLAASRDGPYHSVDNTTPVSLKLIDSDPHAALLITEGLGNWTAVQANQSLAHLDYGPPFGVFANNVNYTLLAGLQDSFCALNRAAQIQDSVHRVEGSNQVETGLTHAQPSNVLEEQFYLPGLNRSSMYLGRSYILNGSYNDPVMGGGGTLYQVMNFTTKVDENCAVIYNLTFCNQVNYAVPANPSRHSSQSLAALYDNTSYSMYQNFSYSLQQIPCNTTPTAQYSLAVDCDDCRNAYKAWLCAVTIPKCEDFSSNYNPRWLNWDGAPSAIPTNAYTYDPSPTDSANMTAHLSSSGSSTTETASRFQNAVPSASPQPHQISTNYLFPRNLAQQPVPNSSYDTSFIPPPDSLQQMWIATNSSRNNETIAGTIQPGPYMEVLPCKDLCYDLVRMCPAALQFSCPAPGSWLENMNYGVRGVGKDGAPTCNAPGAVYYPNTAGRAGLWEWWAVIWVVVVVTVTQL